MVPTYWSHPSYINALFLRAPLFRFVSPGKDPSVHVLDFIEAGMLELQAGFIGPKAGVSMDRRLAVLVELPQALF
jgi:hypothetical protein